MSADDPPRRWGRAGVRLTPEEIEANGRAARRRINQSRRARSADDRIAYRLWLAGELKPYLITLALDAAGLWGPQVDIECGAEEPDVDLWEAGKLYPTWEQLRLLAELTGKTPRFLCSRHEPLTIAQTSMRMHERDYVEQPRVWAFTPEAVAKTVTGAPLELVDADDDK